MSTKEHADYPYDRPVIIIAAPRSGSTLLFETLSHAKDLWTIGGESHGVFENLRNLNPLYEISASNRLTADDANRSTITSIRRAFYENLRDRDGRPYTDVANRSSGRPRFLEKTPKNALRVPFLNQVFPDARYIYLFRDPRENMSSIIEAWRSTDFVTYPRLPDWPGKWSFLLPPEYGRLKGTSLEEIVAFQWRAANEFILDDLGEMPADRWTAVGYGELLADTPATIERLCQFADIEYDEGLQSHCQSTLPLSRFTQSMPTSDKWRKNEQMIERVMCELKPLVERIEAAVAPHTTSGVLQSGAIDDTRDEQSAVVVGPSVALSRNARCHCESGLRYKHCHGAIQSNSVRVENTKA